MNVMSISLSDTINYLGLHYSCSLNFHGQAYHQTAVAKRSATMILRALRIQDLRLINFKSHVRSNFEYCPIIFTLMRKADGIAIENAQPAFTGIPFVPHLV